MHEEKEPVELEVSGTIPPYVSGTLCTEQVREVTKSRPTRVTRFPSTTGSTDSRRTTDSKSSNPTHLHVSSINPVRVSTCSSKESARLERGQKGHASGIQSLWVRTDAAVMREIDPETLEPMDLANQDVLHPELPDKLSAAHAKSDPVTRDVFNYNLALGSTPTYKVFRVFAATGETEILATITHHEASLLQSHQVHLP